jgi:putative phosphoesterase
VRIGAISDTHRSLVGARRLIEKMGDIELLLHAGDHCLDMVHLVAGLSLPVQGVRGNCDLDRSIPQEEILSLKGWRILLTHGHLYRVKSNYLTLVRRAKEVEADLVVFGHTHKPVNLVHRGIKLLNPGTAGIADEKGRLTGAVINLGEKIKIDIITVYE